MQEMRNYDACTNEVEADILMDMLNKHIKMGGVTRISVMSSSRGQVCYFSGIKALTKRFSANYCCVYPTLHVTLYI